MFLLAVRQHGQGDLRVRQAQSASGEEDPEEENLRAHRGRTPGAQFNRHISRPRIRPRTLPKSFLEF